MQTKTSELTGTALDWAVAKCEGLPFTHGDFEYSPDGRVFQRGGCSVERRYSTDWAQGGPIIEREGMDVDYAPNERKWYAHLFTFSGGETQQHFMTNGPTPLIAAMRCLVCSKLGDTVDIPEELVK